MYIETKRLTVRTFRESDAEALYKIKTDPQVRKYIPDFLDLDAQSGDMVNFIRVDYLIVTMDMDNPASYRTAEKSGFKPFEKRTVYDYSYNRCCDDYYYFRRYYSKCTLTDKFYGDSPYTGRSTKGGEQ